MEKKIDEIIVKLREIRVELEALQEIVEHSGDATLTRPQQKKLEELMNEWRDTAEFVEY